MQLIISNIASRKVVGGVIGLGYVGLPLATALAKVGFKTIGFDVSLRKVDAINKRQSYIRDIDNEELSRVVDGGFLRATADFSQLAECDFISICVPTPLGKSKDPDMSFIIQAVNQVKTYLRRGQVVILESTTYPGTTEELVLPLLAESGLEVGKDFYLAFSPERIDPGNEQFHIKNTPKIIGGVTAQCTKIAASYYQAFIDTVIPVSSPSSAEMVKLLENTFRAVNIGLANEIAIMCNHLGIDTWEVIRAAASKPFGFMPFYPGPGLGGHCIPVDPHYLVWKLKSLNYNARFIQLAEEVNAAMPQLVVDKIASALNDHGKPVKGSKILILGAAYKRDIDDYRESPALEVLYLLQKRGAILSYNDPYIPSLRLEGLSLDSVPINTGIAQYDCVAVLTHHSSYDMKHIVAESRLLVDTRNATQGIESKAGQVIKL